jgi:hypothetical protein
MRKILVLTAALAASGVLAAGATAQSYGTRGYSNDTCADVKTNGRVAGAVIGGLLGGALGNGVAAKGNRDEGTALGALVGAAIGSGVGGQNVDCNPTRYGPANTTAYRQPVYQQPVYGEGGYYRQSGYGHSSNDDLYGGRTVYGQRQPVYQQPVYQQPVYQQTGVVYGSQTQPSHDPYGRDYGYPVSSGTPVARDCQTVTRITRLPDGSEIREPITACREASYGSWQVNR